MDTLRKNLITKIDDLLSQATSWEHLSEDAQITIEANVQAPTAPQPSTIPLESIRLGQLRTPPSTPREGSSPTSLQRATRKPLATDEQPSKRRKTKGSLAQQKSTTDTLIEGIWERIYDPRTLDAGSEELSHALHSILKDTSIEVRKFKPRDHSFTDVTQYCRQVIASNKTIRPFEVMVQAYWVDCYNARLKFLEETRPQLRSYEHRKMVLTEACEAFSWSDKELRNRMAIWKGYSEIKDAAGWPALVFAGSGIYRFCKYRVGFDHESMTKLQKLRIPSEVAADTLQPQWRQLLALVDGPTEIRWKGHPHDWSVSDKHDPLPLPITYRQWDADFSFKHLEESTVDKQKWGDQDPRRSDHGPTFYCKSCEKKQSILSEDNECECFPSLYGSKPRTPCPVQIFQTENGRNNGLIARCAFGQGVAIGEFVGLITKGLADVDVMQSQVGDSEPFQIWQGRSGNYTRFINHSCQSNCQFETFTWLGIQRIVVVSKGVSAGEEITVDYSSRYWDNLEKVCLCGEPDCRYPSGRLAKKSLKS